MTYTELSDCSAETCEACRRGRAYYAGRTFMLNNQRILFGWVPTRANETDSANLWYRPEADKEDGTLGCRIPDTVWNAFQDEKKLDDVKLEKESGRALQHVVTKTGDCYRYEADVTFTEGTRGFSIGVRAQEADDEFYSFTFECPKDRVIFEKSGEGICLGVTDGSAVFENQSIAYL